MPNPGQSLCLIPENQIQGILQFDSSGRFSESFEFLFGYFRKLFMATFPVGHHACPNKKDPMAQVLARGTSLQEAIQEAAL